MTCIVGVETENSVIIAGDLGSSTRNTIDPTRLKKVFLKKYPSENENNKMIIGYSSSFRMGQLLEYKLNIPEQEPFTLDLEYLSTVFIDEVRKVLKKGGFTKIENNEESGWLLFGRI